MSGETKDRYDDLIQSVMDDTLPRVHEPCEHCSVPGVPFAVGGNGKNGLDKIIGIPSMPDAVTTDWFMSNPWITDPEQNFRDTFLLRVLKELGKNHDVAWLAKFHAFVSSDDGGYQFSPLEAEIDKEMDNPDAPFHVMDMAVAWFGAVKSPTAPTLDFSRVNFQFSDNKIYYWSFTSAHFSLEQEPNWKGDPVTARDWSISGQFNPAAAARHLADNYAQQKVLAQIGGFIEVASSLLYFVPVLGEMKAGGTVLKGLRYTVVVINRLIAANALIDGTNKMITGKGIDVGEKMFESMGALADPKNGAQRGRLVYMGINLAMSITPEGGGIAEWRLRNISQETTTTVRLETSALSAEERVGLAGHENATVTMVEVRLTKEASVAVEEGKVLVTEIPSLDANKWVTVVESEAGRANFTVTAQDARKNLLNRLGIFNNDEMGLGRLRNVVGDAGEMAIAQTLTERWGVKPENIMGYRPKGKSIFGLTNKNRHGLDVLVEVPPPPSIEVRVPTDKQRNLIDGIKGTAATKTLEFKPGTVVVFEVKSALGGKKTPKLSRLQANGESNVKRITNLIGKKKGVWNEKNRKAADPEGWQTKYDAVVNAARNKRIEYIHAQVFFNAEGKVNQLVGRGTGIQLNTW